MTQAEAIKIMMDGKSVFLTGPPGAGKTYTLDLFIEAAEKAGKRLAITASTGIAASHIGGVTIHSWSGLGIQDSITDDDIERMQYKSRIVKRYKHTDVLIIDEVSMLHGARLDMVNRVARALRKNDQPFGGMQVILVGDLFQLPPVTRGSDEMDFVHLCPAWAELDPTICYLTEQHRQAGDDPLLDLLIAMRENAVTAEHKLLLKNRTGVTGDRLTKLYSHNIDVDMINRRKLDELSGKPKRYYMSHSGDSQKVAALVRNLLAPETLELKVGAEVMFVANDFNAGFVNGTRGKVTKFKDGEPIVKLDNGRSMRVHPHDWITKENDLEVARVTQVPLRLAWAITIHKSQGMTLDAAEIDLSQAFTTGMGYVALSRVRSMKGLYLIGINDMALRMHPEIYEFDAIMRRVGV